MPVRSIQDQAEALLTRRVAEAKTSGAMSPDVEAAALIEIMAVVLMLLPRSVLYVEHLARNGLLANVTQTLSALAVLRSAIVDLANKTYALKDLSDLEDAKNSLLQLEDLPRISPDSDSYRRFSRSVDSFLNKHLAKNVKVPGSFALARPGQEAAADLQPSLQAVSDLYTDFLSRLYSLATGVSNFSRSTLSSILSVSTITRSRADLEDLLASMKADGSGAQSRDAAVRLITNRAAIKTLGSPPSITNPVTEIVGTSNGVKPCFILTTDVSQIVSPGDVVAWASGTAVIKVVTPYIMNLMSVPPALSKTPITVTSSLNLFHNSLMAQLLPFVQSFSTSKFGAGIKPLDSVVAPLVGSSTAAQRNEALSVLDALAAQLTSLSTILSGSQLPDKSAAVERKTINGLILTLQERKYDRALSMFLKCQIVDIFELDYKSLSFAGNMIKSLSDVAQKDVTFPSKARDELGKPVGHRSRTDLL